MHHRRLLVSLIVSAASGALLLAAACSHPVRRYEQSAPMWEDPDRNDVPEQPGKFYSGINGDGADKLFLYPLSQAFAFPKPGESKNVNSIDEVPNSSWFQNRIGWFDISPERGAKAECGDAPSLDPEGGKWVVKGAKPDGANPGFIIKAPDDNYYLLKFDGHNQPLRASTADVVGSKLYWLMGYHSVCNEIVHFDPSILQMDPEATTEEITGKERPMTRADIDKVLGEGFLLKDGTIRASASRFVSGNVLGPFKYERKRRDDPNDVVAHEDRRELRAAHLPAAWLNHVDAREQNTLDVLVEDQGREYIRHYKLDWGDCLGLGWKPDRLGRRFGHSYIVDFRQMGEDLVTFGLMDRPWNDLTRSKVHIFGYYDVDRFVPSQWKGVYPIPAFTRRTPRDILWMVRILSRISDEHIRQIVAEAKLPDARQAAYLTRTLIGRRDKFFKEYLKQHVPLGYFQMARRDADSDAQSVCFEDLAIKHGVAQGDEAYYQMRFYGGEKLKTELGWVQFTPDEEHPSWSCVQLPLGHRRPALLAPVDAPDNHPLRYGVMNIWVHERPSVKPMGQVRLHFYDLGEKRGFQLVGIERPDQIVLPDNY